MAQMRVLCNEYERNMSNAEKFVSKASEEKADVVVFPECSDIGWLTSIRADIAEKRFGESVAVISSLARQHNICIAIGLTEGSGKELFNSSVLVSRYGEVLLKHRKINLLDFEEKVYSRGMSLSSADSPAKRTGILICADNFPQSLSLGRSLGLMGVRLVLSPSSWAIEPELETDPDEKMWLSSYRKLAISYGITTVAVSNVGTLENPPWRGYKCIGNSMAIDKNGSIISRCSFGENEDFKCIDLEYL